MPADNAAPGFMVIVTPIPARYRFCGEKLEFGGFVELTMFQYVRRERIYPFRGADFHSTCGLSVPEGFGMHECIPYEKSWRFTVQQTVAGCGPWRNA